MSETFEHRLAAVAHEVEACLAGILEIAGEPAPPRRLSEAMAYAALGGGKRLRPFLLVETAAMLGGDAGTALRAGSALELLHVYSLVHDDLPSMDDDDVRRGRPTVHRAYDEATAVLVGDTLQTLAFETLADPATSLDAGLRAGLTLTLARAAGRSGMAGGQMYDLMAEGRYGEAAAPGADDIRRLQAMKTGALMLAAVQMGALVGGADRAADNALTAYGRAVGAAFQIADDILDVEASAETMGKATGKDAGRGKGTLVGALGLEEARRERDRLTEAAVAALEPFGDAAGTLREAAVFTARRRS